MTEGAAHHGRDEDYGRSMPNPVWRQRLHLRSKPDEVTAERPLTFAELEAALLDMKSRIEMESLRNREESSKRRRGIALNNAAILLIWFGALAILVLTLVLIAVGVEYLIWLNGASAHHAAAAELFPAGLLGLLTSATSGLSLLTIGALCRRARAAMGNQ